MYLSVLICIFHCFDRLFFFCKFFCFFFFKKNNNIFIFIFSNVKIDLFVFFCLNFSLFITIETKGWTIYCHMRINIIQQQAYKAANDVNTHKTMSFAVDGFNEDINAEILYYRRRSSAKFLLKLFVGAVFCVYVPLVALSWFLPKGREDVTFFSAGAYCVFPGAFLTIAGKQKKIIILHLCCNMFFFFFKKNFIHFFSFFFNLVQFNLFSIFFFQIVFAFNQRCLCFNFGYLFCLDYNEISTSSEKHQRQFEIETRIENCCHSLYIISSCSIYWNN